MKSLIERLLSRLTFKSYNPTKGKKKEKQEVSYFHVSNVYTEHTDKNGNTYLTRKGITYTKPLEI